MATSPELNLTPTTIVNTAGQWAPVRDGLGIDDFGWVTWSPQPGLGHHPPHRMSATAHCV